MVGGIFGFVCWGFFVVCNFFFFCGVFGVLFLLLFGVFFSPESKVAQNISVQLSGREGAPCWTWLVLLVI